MWVDRTLEEFGQSIGMPGLRFNDQGVVMLTFERMGTLFLERHEEQILMYMVRKAEHAPLAVFRRALGLCHYQENQPFELHVGLRREDDLVFLVKIPEQEFILPTVERALQFLDYIHGAAVSTSA